MMAFRRKDVSKAYYYVWFLGARESKGLRGEQYIISVLRQLVNVERRTEPCKVTIQISNKGIKIIQNVPKKQSLPNGQTPVSPSQHIIENQKQQTGHPVPINNLPSNLTPSKQNSTQNATVKMEQIKHFIPHHAITCALQSEDVVCIILLLYNPLTGCPVHVHGYRCDSVETAFTLRNQLQLLIERPENQRKFAEIETRLAAKGLISQQQLLNNNTNNMIPKLHQHQQIVKTANQLTNGNDYKTQSNNIKSIHQTSSANHSTATQLIYTKCNDSTSNGSKRNTLTSDGRSAEDDYNYNQSDGYSPTTIRSEPDGQPSLNKSLVESKSSSGNSSGSSGSPPPVPNPVVVEMYENLAAELKAKLGNPQTGPILLPPRDYDTVCRSQGKLIELDQRACTNKLVVGKLIQKKVEKLQPIKKRDNVVLDTNVKKEIKSEIEENNKIVKEIKNVKDKIRETKDVKEKEEIKEIKSTVSNYLKEKELINKENNTIVDMQDNNRLNPIKLTKNELNEQAQRLNHQQIREQQKQYEQKLKDLQRKQELYEHQQLLIEQQKQVRRELAQQHKPPRKFVMIDDKLINSKPKTEITTIDKNLESNSNSKKHKTKGLDESVATSIAQQSTKLPASKNQIETTAVIHQASGIKQIGSNLANKIKQSLIGSNKDKLEPQLICHKTIHDSLQSLNKLGKSELIKSNEKYLNKNLKQIDNLLKKSKENEKPTKNQINCSIVKSNTLNTKNTSMSNSSSNISRDLNEKLNTINSRSDSSNVSKSISSGIGSGANLNKTNANNYDDPQYLSTDEELDEEILLRNLSECVDDLMPDYSCNKYLNDGSTSAVDQDEDDEIIDDLDEEVTNRVVRRMAIREKLLLMEKKQNQKCKERRSTSASEHSVNHGVQMTSSEEDDGTNSICYDENLMPKINTAKRIKKPMKIDKKLNKIEKSAKTNSSSTNKIKIDQQQTSSTKSTSVQSSINQVKRSETYYDQKKFNQNYYFPSSKSPLLNSLDSSILNHQPKLFYFPNPPSQQTDFSTTSKQLQYPQQSQSQLMKYHLGQQIKQCELRRQKSTPNVNGKIKMNYHPMLIGGSVEKLIASDLKPNLVSTNLAHHKQRSRPISMVNMMQSEHFRISHPPIESNGVFKRVPIYY